MWIGQPIYRSCGCEAHSPGVGAVSLVIQSHDRGRYRIGECGRFVM